MSINQAKYSSKTDKGEDADMALAALEFSAALVDVRVKRAVPSFWSAQELCLMPANMPAIPVVVLEQNARHGLLNADSMFSR